MIMKGRVSIVLAIAIALLLGFGLGFLIQREANKSKEQSLENKIKIESNRAYEQGREQGFMEGSAISGPVAIKNFQNDNFEKNRMELDAILEKYNLAMAEHNTSYNEIVSEINQLLDKYRNTLTESDKIREDLVKTASSGDLDKSLSYAVSEINALTEAIGYANELFNKHREITQLTDKHIVFNQEILYEVSEKVGGVKLSPKE